MIFDSQELTHNIFTRKGNNWTAVITHISPDFDTAGSALALTEILRLHNINAFCICADRLGGRMEKTLGVTQNEAGVIYSEGDFIPSFGNLREFVPFLKTIIAVDTASPDLLGAFRFLYHEDNRIDFVFDHHYTNAFYGKHTYLDASAAACGEVIFAVAKAMHVDFSANQKIARYLYAAVSADSGSFKYSNTTPETMRIAAELIGSGIDFAKLNRMIYQNKSLTQIQVERLAYNCLRFFADGRIGIISITAEMKRDTGLEGVKIDGITDIARVVEGVEVGIIIKQEDPLPDGTVPDKYKISMRSNDYLNVAEIAAVFGGGGHVHAAGCRAEMKLDDLESVLIDAITAKLI